MQVILHTQYDKYFKNVRLFLQRPDLDIFVFEF